MTFHPILRLHDLEDKASSEDLDVVLQHHHSMQEKLAEEMLSLTRSLKHNTVVASNIIKDDNRVRNSVLNFSVVVKGDLNKSSKRAWFFLLHTSVPWLALQLAFF